MSAPGGSACARLTGPEDIQQQLRATVEVVPAGNLPAVATPLRWREPGVLRRRDGSVLTGAWAGPITPADEEILRYALAPALDVGCGPARHSVALAERGIPSMGIDVAPPAVDEARRRGVPTLERGIFDRLPGSGRWGSVLLLDGNLGLAGDPEALLSRVCDLLRPRGRILLETAPAGSAATVDTVRLELDGAVGPWFEWAVVPTETALDVAEREGLAVRRTWCREDRCFVVLDLPHS